MSAAPIPGDRDNFNRDQTAALIRTLTNLLNQRAGDRLRSDDNFRRYGVLLEAILSRHERFDGSLAGTGNSIIDHLEEMFDYIKKMDETITGRQDLLDVEFKKLRTAVANESNLREQDYA